MMDALNEYLPHRAPMILLDRIISLNEEEAITEVNIRPDSEFCDGVAVGGWVGIEYMAQTVGVLGGYLSRQKGEAIKTGLLLGARHYQCHCPVFLSGSVLRITARIELQAANGLWSFHCMIHDEKTATLLAQANLKVYQVDDINQIRQR